MSVKLSRSVVAGKVGQVVLETVIVAAVLPLLVKARLVGKVTEIVILELGALMQVGRMPAFGRLVPAAGKKLVPLPFQAVAE